MPIFNLIVDWNLQDGQRWNLKSLVTLDIESFDVGHIAN